MKKREIVATLTVMAAFGMSACGTRELDLTANQVEVELGSELDTAVTSYVADADVAAKAVIDFSAVDMMKTGTYNAIVTYKDQTAGFEVVVVDTTAPEVTVADQVVVAAGEPLYAEDVITSIIEFSGEAGVVFSEPETSADGASADAGEESVEETEAVENTEMVDELTEGVENSEAAEAVEETESAVDSAETTEEAEPETEFILDDVLCSNAYVIYPETGEYDNTLTVTDASGNSTDVTVHIVVGDAPEIEGVEDMTVTVGTSADEIDFLDGVTAKDSSGNDITANIVCDSAAVDFTTEGEYTVTYTVTDENGFTATKTATVNVEEKNGKKSDSKSDSGKKNDSGKTDSAKKNDSASSSSSSNSSNNNNAASNGASGGNNASSGNSNQASGDSGNSGNNASSGNSNNASGDNGNSGNNNQTSGGSSTSGDSGNSDNSGNASTPSTDNGGNTGEPSTPSVPSTDNGNASTGSGNDNYEMSVPDSGFGTNPIDPGLLDNTGTGGTDGGDVTGGGSF